MSTQLSEKKGMPLVYRMLIALIGGIVLGLCFLFLHQHLVDSGQEAT